MQNAAHYSMQKVLCLAAAVAMLAVGTAGLVAAPAGAAGPTTTVVTAASIAPHGPWSLEPTSNTGSYSFVTGPGTPPGGVGSLAMSIAAGQHEWLNNYTYGVNATPLANLTALGFSTYRQSGSTWPTLNVQVDPSGTGSGYSTFIFIPNSGSIANSTWQAWNALSPADGSWISSQDVGSGPFNCTAQSCSATWAQILAGYPNAKVKYGLGPNLGTGGSFVGSIDDLQVGVLGSTTTYDFEPAPSAPRPVAAVPGNGAAKVTWKPPTSDGGSPVTGYAVTPYIGAVAQPVHVYNSTATTQTVKGLHNAKLYRFEIAAQNAVGTGAWSTQSGGTIVGAPGQPGKPTVKVVSNGLKVSFKAPMNNGAAITSFTATCAPHGNGLTKAKSGKASPIVVSGVTGGSTYTCVVTATNSRGTGPRSIASATVTP